MAQPAIFHRAAIEAIREFPDDVQKSLGLAIWDLQLGKRLGMPLSRPMRSVARGVEELRIKDASGTYRAFYILRSLRGVIVFHAFQKKSQKTPPSEIVLGQRRLKEMLYEES